MNWRTWLLSFVAVCAAAQPRGLLKPPGRQAPSRSAPVRAPYFQPMWWPWSGTSTVVVKETKPEFEAPNAITNKDYVPERLHPVMNEYPEGSLPPGREAASSQPKGACRIVFQDGSREEGQACDLQANALVYLARHGIHKRFSLDLINLDQTQFE